MHLKRLGIPYSQYELPNQVSDRPWQYQYTFLCFGLSFALAALVTYLVEKPGAKLLKRWFEAGDEKRKARYAASAREAAGKVESGDVLILSDIPAGAQAAMVEELQNKPILVAKAAEKDGKIDVVRQEKSPL